MSVTVGAGAVAWLSVHRFGGSARIWLAAGIIASALGDVLYQIVALVNDSPNPTSRSPTSPGSRPTSVSASPCSSCSGEAIATTATTSTA